MISDWAFERVSTRPRATRARSRRTRFCAVAPPLIVIAATRRRIWNRGLRDAIDRSQHATRNRLIGRFPAVGQNKIGFVARVAQTADVERAPALSALQPQTL